MNFNCHPGDFASARKLMNERSIYSMIIFGIVIENIVPLSISELASIEP